MSSLRLGTVRLVPLQTGLATGVLVLGAACVWLVVGSGSLPESVAASPLPPLHALETPSRPLSPHQYDAIVSRNAFARSRQPPAMPWAPVEPGVEGDAAAGPRMDETLGLPGPLRLYGTVAAHAPQGSFAIIEADPSRLGPERYRVGDSVGSYRLRAIYRGRVILTGPGGQLTLTLAPDTAGGVTP